VSRPWFPPAGSRDVSHLLCVSCLCCRPRVAVLGPRAAERRLCPYQRDARGHVSVGCRVWGSDAVGPGRTDCEVRVSVCILLWNRPAALPYVSWTLMNQAMSDHFVLSLETLTSWASRTVGYRAEVWSIGGVYVSMAIEQVLRLERCCSATGESALEGTRSERSICL
jgi:hypothetical protein